MINILFVFGDLFKRGGTETVMKNIFDHIDSERFHIDFLLLSDEPDDTDMTKHIESCGSTVYHIVRRGKDYRRHKQELRKFFTEHTYDIVHTHMDAIGDQALFEAKRAGIKVRVAHSHNTDQKSPHKNIKEHLHKMIIKYERSRVRRLATHFAACSTEAGEWLFGQEICSSDRYLLFKNAIDPEGLTFSNDRYLKAREELGINDEVVIGHVGSFNYQKNHEFLIRVFAEVSKKINAKLVLVGAGTLEQGMKNLVAELGITDRVLFLGSRPDVSELLQGMDVFAFPSHFEGLGIAVIEAQAAGLKCVVSDRVPSEADVSGLVKFMPIDNGTECWTNAIVKAASEKYERISPIEKIRDAGYDMRTEIHELERFYTDAVNNVC